MGSANERLNDEGQHSGDPARGAGANITSDPSDLANILESILESPPDIVIFALDLRLRYVAFNQNHARTMRAIWGAEVEIGTCMLDLIGREDDRERARANFERALAGEAFTQIEAYGDEAHTRRVYEDAYAPIRNAAGDILGLTVFLTDVTERERLREQIHERARSLSVLVQTRTEELERAQDRLLHAQKLESLGLMAGGLAHDFNNLLVAMLGSAELALERLPPDVPGRALVAQVVTAASQASEITGQMLAYASGGRRTPRRCELHQIIHTQRNLLRALVPHSIELVYELAPVDPILADATQLGQVVVNLVSNAADAQPKGGRIVVRTRMAALGPERRSAFRLGALGEHPMDAEYVMLEVEDEGAGMDRDTAERLFDPFFSTKAPGRGLGLSSVMGILRRHDADITVSSALGEGSRFEVAFKPAADGRFATTKTAPVDAAETADAGDAPKVALVVDDDEQVRGVMVMMLEQFGTRAITAGDGAVGVMKLEALDTPVDLVVLDLTMPRQGGIETLEVIRRDRPWLPVLLVSGYDVPQTSGYDWRSDPHTRFLAKPFTVESFRSAVEEVLRTRT